MSDEYEGLSSSFAEACRQADAAYKPPPPQSEQQHVTQSTYDAVQYVLRHYGDRYEDPDWLMTRLAHFSPRQLNDLLIWIDRYGINPRLRTLVARFKR